MVDEEEQPIDVEEVTVTTAPQTSRLHMFTNLARAVCTCVSYMWGSFCCIITPIRDHSPWAKKPTPPHPGIHQWPVEQGLGST